MRKFEYVTIRECAARMGIDDRRVRYLLDKKELEDNGRTGKARRVKYYRDGLDKGDDDAGEMTHDKAKLRKLIADAKIAEQKLLEIKAQNFSEWSDLFFEKFMVAFGPLKSELIKLRLDPAQTKALNRILDTCFTTLSNDLKTISQFENT